MPEPENPIRVSSAAGRELRRLGKNVQGYFGETIDIDAVLKDCAAAAQVHGWRSDPITVLPGMSLPAYQRIQNSTDRNRPRIYISAGIHGDEPAGPAAVRLLLQQHQWPAGLDYWLCPCLNPAGFRLNRRENADGIDLNRQYKDPSAAETIAHIAWLERQPRFDLCLCLHEDWESHGFYVYELNLEDRPPLAERIVAGVAEVCPIDCSPLIEGRTACNGVIRPSINPAERPQWPEAFYLLTHKTRVSCTLEAPSDFPLSARVAALAAGMRAALEIAAGNVGGP